MVELIHDYLYIESIKFFKSEDFAFFEKRLDIISPGFVRDNSNGPSLARFYWGKISRKGVTPNCNTVV